MQLRVVPEHQLTAHPPAVIAGALETFAEETIQLAELVDRVLAGRRHPRRAVSGQAGRRSKLAQKSVELAIGTEPAEDVFRAGLGVFDLVDGEGAGESVEDGAGCSLRARDGVDAPCPQRLPLGSRLPRGSDAPSQTASISVRLTALGAPFVFGKMRSRVIL